MKPTHTFSIFALSVIAASCGVAWGQDRENENGLDFTALQRFKYDSNVFRLPDGANTPATSDAGQRSDWISTTQVGASFDKTFGLHHLYLSLAPNVVRYFKFDQFNYVGHNAVADWSGLVGSDGKYGLRYERTRAASDLAEQIQPDKNIVTSDAFAADLVVRTGEMWQGVTTWRATRSRNSATLEQGGDNHGWSADAGVRLVPSTGNRVDLRYRRSQYEYPNVIPSQISDNSYKQNEEELSWDWKASEASHFEGRTSYMQRKHDHFHERDFNGMAGNFKYIWQPTVASSLTANAFRELGAVTDASASYARTYGLSLTPTWDLDAEFAFGGLLEWRHRRYEGFSLIGRPDEHTVTSGVSTTYKPTHNWAFIFGLNDERRHSSDATRTYSVWAATLTARWAMR